MPRRVRGGTAALLLAALLGFPLAPPLGLAEAQPSDAQPSEGRPSGGGPSEVGFDTGDDPDSRLEIRTVTLPTGEEVELFVLTGDPAVVTVGEDVLSGRRIELDVGNRVVRVIGDGSFTSGGETITGENLTIRIDEEQLAARAVVVATEQIDVVGDRASRVPGRIQVVSGAFSPCARCGQEVEDYGFRARRLELYPGDRLVAFDVTILVRGAAIATVPLLVLPLGPEDRRPSVTITRGSEDERAVVAIAWPYVAGANALGTLRVRYEADVDPTRGGFPASQLLGGAVVQSYLGGSVDHRFYTERGSGTLTAGYTPGYVEDGAATEEELAFSVAYATAPELSGLRLELSAQRDDAVRRDVAEYALAASDSDAGVRATVTSRGFVDLDPGDDVDTPSYDGATTPLRTALRLELEPERPLEPLGPLRFGNIRVDLGAFEDQSNDLNRSAAGTPRIASARLRALHAESLDQPLWAGARLFGDNRFDGYYYATGERQIEWDTTLGLEQRFGGVGALTVDYVRRTREGETPFRFDRLQLQGQSDLNARLSLSPASWLRLDSRTSYRLTDTRTPEEIGFQPLDTDVALFGNLAWIELAFANDWDLAEGDPGELDTTLRLSGSDGPLRAEIALSHSEDLAPGRPRRGDAGADPDRAEVADESETRGRIDAALGRALAFELETGYRWAEPPGEGWEELELALTAGTLEQDDALPGVRIGVVRDPNRGETTDLDLRATARIGPVEIDAEQSFDYEDESITTSRLSVLWPGIAELRTSGLPLLDPTPLGIPYEPRPTRHTYEVLDAFDESAVTWSVAYRATLDPRFDEATGTTDPLWRDRSVDARVELERAIVGGVRLELQSRALFELSDEDQPVSYLRDLDLLRVGIDIGGVVGVQGGLTYRARYNAAAEEFGSRRLDIVDVTVAARLSDEFVLGATLDDVWELTGDDPSRSPYNFQPTVFFAYDRCCWALYGSWDTATGAITLTLTTPGGEDGFGDTFDTPLTLPGRGAEGELP